MPGPSKVDKKRTLVAVWLDRETLEALEQLEKDVDPDVVAPRPIAIRRAIRFAAAQKNKQES